jgi:hypothetical protein
MMTIIHFERTGGFVARKTTLTLDLDSLPSDQAETLRGLLDQADFFSLTDSPAQPVPDEFHYTITVTTKMVEHTVHTSDTSANETLRSLVNNLSQRTRGH